MRINSNDNQGYLTIELLEKATDGSVRFYIDAVYSGLTGNYKKIWIEEDSLNNFLSALHNLEQTRQGEASLVSMSPNEFHLKLFSGDSIGHIGLLTLFKKPSYLFSKSYFQRTEITFEIDAGCMREIVDDFNALNKQFQQLNTPDSRSPGQ